MKKVLALFIGLSLSTGIAFAQYSAISETFTAAQNGTIPVSMTSDWDASVPDVKVVPLATAGVPSDHTNGDGYVLQVADVGSGGWNFAYNSNYTTNNAADSKTEAWVYLNFDTATTERSYAVFVRGAEGTAHTYGAQAIYNECYGYWLLVTKFSSWGTFYPPDYKAFILKKISGNWVQIGSTGTGTYNTGWHKMKITASGNQIKGYVDDNLEVSATDDTYATGFGGVGYYEGGDDVNAVGAFDNFVWEQMTSVKEWSLY